VYCRGEALILPAPGRSDASFSSFSDLEFAAPLEARGFRLVSTLPVDQRLEQFARAVPLFTSPPRRLRSNGSARRLEACGERFANVEEGRHSEG
jgi:hypothetical protein